MNCVDLNGCDPNFRCALYQNGPMDGRTHARAAPGCRFFFLRCRAHGGETAPRAQYHRLPATRKTSLKIMIMPDEIQTNLRTANTTLCYELEARIVRVLPWYGCVRCRSLPTFIYLSRSPLPAAPAYHTCLPPLPASPSVHRLPPSTARPPRPAPLIPPQSVVLS